MKKPAGKLFIVSGPSGAGKSTLTKKITSCFDNLKFSISYTTRKPRTDEVAGIDYRFVDEIRFEEMVKAGEFAEHATVHGKKYGTGEKDLKKMLKKGMDVILDIDVQGAEQLRKKSNGGVYIFVVPPSMDECLERKKKRGEVNPKEIQRRFKTSKKEVKKIDSYDYVIINDSLEGAYEQLKNIIVAERARKKSLKDKVKKIFNA